MKEKSKLTVGIDEAGRGPILGPLVIAALAINEDDKKKLEWLGVKDSKLLSAEVREELFDRIRELKLESWRGPDEAIGGHVSERPAHVR